MHLPRVGVGAVVIRDGRILLVRRGTHPGKGLWAVPGGLVKPGETLQHAAEREILEETGIVIRAGDPFYTFDLIQRAPDGALEFHYVIVDLRADYVSGEVTPGDDADDARWVAEEELESMPVTPTTRKLLRTMGFSC